LDDRPLESGRLTAYTLSSHVSPRVRTEQIPAVAFQIKKDSDFAVRLDARPRDKANPSIYHSLIQLIEVFDPQEQTDTSAELLSDYVNLMFAISACKDDTCLGSGWPDDDPAFRTAIIRERRCVFGQLEPEYVDEEPNSGFILPHNECHQCKIRHRS